MLEEIARNVNFIQADINPRIDGKLKPTSNVYVAKIENDGYIQNYTDSNNTSVSTADEEFTRPRRQTSPIRHPVEKIEFRKRSSSTNTKSSKVVTPSATPKFGLKTVDTFKPLKKILEVDGSFSSVAEVVKEEMKRSKTPVSSRFMDIHRRSPDPVSPQKNIYFDYKNRLSVKDSLILKKNSLIDYNRCFSVKERVRMIRDSYGVNSRLKLKTLKDLKF